MGVLPDNSRVAYFGIYIEGSVESPDILPDKKQVVGYLSYAIASALPESGNKSFKDYAQSIVELMRSAVRQTSSPLPVFEASDSARSPFATGLRASAATRGVLRSRRPDASAGTWACRSWQYCVLDWEASIIELASP